MIPAKVVMAFSEKRLVLTITSGRSGTSLLAAVLRRGLNIEADHEPAPRINFVLRSILADPEMGPAWLVTEKIPAMLGRAAGPIYAETSHLFCKGLIEPLLQIGLRPAFIVLSRDAGQVAQSLYKLNVIPGRTGPGRTVLLSPTDPGVLYLPGWERFTDYQLCYWYVREIERRQAYYRGWLATAGIDTFDLAIEDLLDWDAFGRLAAFIAKGAPIAPDHAGFDSMVAVRHNSHSELINGASQRSLPVDPLAEQLELDAVLQSACQGSP